MIRGIQLLGYLHVRTPHGQKSGVNTRASRACDLDEDQQLQGAIDANIWLCPEMGYTGIPQVMAIYGHIWPC